MSSRTNATKWYLFTATALFLMFFLGKLLPFYPYELNDERYSNVSPYLAVVNGSSKANINASLFVNLKMVNPSDVERAAFYTDQEELLRKLNGQTVVAYISHETWPYAQKVWHLTDTDNRDIVPYEEMHTFYAKQFWFAFWVCLLLFIGILFFSAKLYWLRRTKRH